MVVRQGRKSRTIKKSVRRHTKRLKLVQLGEYRAEQILDVIKIKGTFLYKVKWYGYGLKDCTWEPVNHLKNFQDQIDLIHKQKKQIKEYHNLKELYEVEQQIFSPEIIVKTEELRCNTQKLTRRRTTGKDKQKLSLKLQPKTKQFIEVPQNQLIKSEFVKVIDLQQVFHKQTNKIHIVARVIVQEFYATTQSGKSKIKEVQKWIHIDTLRKSLNTLQLLTDFLMENVQYEAKVLYADDYDTANMFQGVEFQKKKYNTK